MVTASTDPPTGSMRGRRLAGVIPLVALTLAVAGCGLFDDDPKESTTATTAPAGTGEELTDADAALCLVVKVLHGVDPAATFEQALTGTDDDARFLLLAVGSFTSIRNGDVRRLGAYEPGIRTIGRRWDRLADPDADPAPEDRPLPTVTATPTEQASIEAADRFLAEDRCPE